MAYLNSFRSNIRVLFDRFMASTGFPPTTASRIIVGDPKYILSFAGRDMLVGTYDTITTRFSALWPADVEWPSEIPRPIPAEVSPEQIQTVQRRIEAFKGRNKHETLIHPEWPADKPWPSDIPKPTAAEPTV